MKTDPDSRIIQLLSFLYGEAAAVDVWPALAARLDAFRRTPYGAAAPAISHGLTQSDAILITYGDQISEPRRPPLQTLTDFLDAELAGAISGVHLLPCFPYSSDDGFSVIDYMQIDPALGDWADVARLGRRYRLMFDFVANHISQHSAWFQAYRRGEAPYDGFFIEADPAADLTQVVRPRALPLLTPVETSRGLRHVWTTFSADQIDLNYADPAVLLAMTEVLLHYVAHGAEIIRLDAIAYLWKEIGTPCIHLPQTHAVVKLWRAVLDAVAPHVLLITETNVPHADNIGYFGRPLAAAGSTDEAQLVYNFSLAPLTLHAFLTGDASKLSAWAATLQAPAGGSFFNFIASHDGIGVLPARGILSDAELEALVERALAHGGQVSLRSLPDGSRTPYELNITLYDFLNDPAQPDPAIDVARFLASQAILLALAGVPGIYVHSLIGSRNCQACFAETGRARSLNRRKFDRAALDTILADPARHEGAVFDGYRRLLRLRRSEPAFDPAGGQRVLDLGPAVFALLRTPPGAGRPLLCLVNVSPERQTVHLAADSDAIRGDESYYDLFQRARLKPKQGTLAVELAGYQVCWLAASPAAATK
ncbi:MAG: DUF3459 domain-containing protein [Caldilineales bacterium]|nr:DUF3459 domain-containing protein [Caldilineales bacterium]